jgi:beta-glucanase (GH16 family)
MVALLVVLSSLTLVATAFAIRGPDTPEPPPVVPSGPPGPWHLVFRDEFNGTTLDPRWWRSGMWWDPQGGGTIDTNNEQEWYSPGNLSVRDGLLNLTATRQTSHHGGRTYQYLSGMATTGPTADGTPKFDFRYGYVEARMKLPKGRGLWPAFWTLNGRPPGRWPPEIDIMEVLGDDPTVAYQHYHYGPQNTDEQWGGPTTVTDLSSGFHTFGVDWSADAIRWYVDGRQVLAYTARSDITAEPMYLLLNLAVGGDWPGSPDASTRLPATMQVDWVRVWQRS